MVGVFLIGTVTGIVASAMGATESAVPQEMSQVERGSEALMVLLERKERALERREATLSTREADLHAAEEQVQERIDELEMLRGDLEGLLVKLDDRREERVKGLVKMFESMRPVQAAAILVETEDVVGFEVLDRMNRAKAGKILAALPPTRA